MRATTLPTAHHHPVVKLVVVESPAKARTLSCLLCTPYEVMATGGHLKDLPSDALGVDTANAFAPAYTVLPGKEKVLSALTRAAAGATEILLATDPDREGEMIASHIADHLSGKTDAPIRRVRCYEVTAAGVQRALETPGEIETTLVQAQQARRVLDRLIGYTYSPFLQRRLPGAVSAGRVQTAALRLLCEREHAIADFLPQRYHTLTATFETASRERFEARLVQVRGLCVGAPDESGVQQVIGEKEAAHALVQEAKAQAWQVARVTRQRTHQEPPAPLTTAALQQAAALSFRFGTKQTMAVAQQLFEGVELADDKPTGLITYPRTDSKRLSGQVVEGIRHLVVRDYGPKYLGGGKPHRNKKHVQDAHEAIRPTDIERTPRAIRKYLTPEQYRLYTLIWERTVASQMAAAELETTVVEVASAGGAFVFQAEGAVRPFRGFLQVHETAGETPPFVPALAFGQGLTLSRLSSSQESTVPPTPYTEGGLVEAMEAHAIGRPATYHTMIQTLIDRRYATLEKHVLRPTDLGLQACTLLIQQAPRLFDVPFTAHLEEQLDRLAEGRGDYTQLIADFYHRRLHRASTTPVTPSSTQGDCPHCGERLTRRNGRYGAFLACSGFPRCRYTLPMEVRNGDGVALAVREETEGGRRCACGGSLMMRHGTHGAFYGCSHFPACRHTEPYVNETAHVRCPQCEAGWLIEKRTQDGRVFYGCSSYPTCTHALWQRPVKQDCTSCGHHFVAEHKSRAGQTQLICPKCNLPTRESGGSDGTWKRSGRSVGTRWAGRV